MAPKWNVADSVTGIRQWWLFLRIGLSIVVFAVLALLFQDRPLVLMGIAVMPLLAVMVLNFTIPFVLLVVFLFININISYFVATLLFVPLVFISFLITYRNLRVTDFANPLTNYIIIYTACVIPSFINMPMHVGPILILWNYIAWILLIYMMTAIIKDRWFLDVMSIPFLVLVTLNALQVIGLAILTQRRVFGFAGIMFVDYVALALTVIIPFIIRRTGIRRFMFIILGMILLFAEFFTQTRGIWLATMMTIGITTVFLFIRSRFFSLSRTRILTTSILTVIILGLSYLAVTTLNPQIANRAQQISETKSGVLSEEGLTNNSYVTRLLIWHTAYQAFSVHPLVGVGMYAFPFVSESYSTIAPILFDRYVKRLTPHVTYIAVLTETGVLGLIGFIALIIGMYRIAIRNFDHCANEEQKTYALSLFMAVVYISCSMTITDAWLWGQGIILWALVLSVTTNFPKIAHSIH
ncbi:MAG: O-antigen ligase family protein [Bacteroidetes bacterium]|nr:O-antigen ligase family protein [Bacteroidota bacterium]